MSYIQGSDDLFWRFRIGGLFLLIISMLLGFIFDLIYNVDLRGYIIGQEFPRLFNVPEDVDAMKLPVVIFNTDYLGTETRNYINTTAIVQLVVVLNGEKFETQ